VATRRPVALTRATGANRIRISSAIQMDEDAAGRCFAERHGGATDWRGASRLTQK